MSGDFGNVPRELAKLLLEEYGGDLRDPVQRLQEMVLKEQCRINAAYSKVQRWQTVADSPSGRRELHRELERHGWFSNRAAQREWRQRRRGLPPIHADAELVPIEGLRRKWGRERRLLAPRAHTAARMAPNMRKVGLLPLVFIPGEPQRIIDAWGSRVGNSPQGKRIREVIMASRGLVSYGQREPLSQRVLRDLEVAVGRKWTGMPTIYWLCACRLHRLRVIDLTDTGSTLPPALLGVLERDLAHSVWITYERAMPEDLEELAYTASQNMDDVLIIPRPGRPEDLGPALRYRPLVIDGYSRGEGETVPPSRAWVRDGEEMVFEKVEVALALKVLTTPI